MKLGLAAWGVVAVAIGSTAYVYVAVDLAVSQGLRRLGIDVDRAA